jgi:hypothetical protein
MGTKVKVNHRLFTYFAEAPSPTEPDKTVLIEKVGFRNDIVELGDFDLERGVRLGSVTPLDAMTDAVQAATLAAAGEGEEDTLDSAEKIRAYMERNNPNVSDTIDLARDENGKIDPDLAQMVLDAENARTGNDPRKGVEDALEKAMADAAGTV